MARFGFGDLLLCGACTACLTAAVTAPPPRSTTYVVIDKTDAVSDQTYVTPGGTVVSVPKVTGVPSLQHLSRDI